MNELNHLNNNFESIYNKKFCESGINNRPNTALNNKNVNSGANELSNYNSGKDSLFGLKQTNYRNNNINNKNSKIKNDASNKGNYGRANSLENNSI